jgi:secreted trypsin-like serine protease
MYRAFVAALSLFLVLAAVGCSEMVDPEVDTARFANPIINGDAPDAPMHDAVGSLHYMSGNLIYADYFCSGTLIAEDVVLTAAHCLDEARGGPNFKTMAPENLAIQFTDDIGTAVVEDFYFATETLIHPDYDRNELFNDIALVRLDRAVNVTPVAALPAGLGFTQDDVNQELVLNFAGFGLDGYPYGSDGVKLQADGVLGGLGCTVSGCWGLDDPDTQISYDQSAPNGPCFGDSGGPAFLFRSGTAYVGGVTSWGDSYCAEFGVSTRVDAFDGWIDTFVNQTPPPDPYCGDGECNGDETCSTCEADCGVCPPDPYCGDGECNGDETCSTCEADCGPCATCGGNKDACTTGDDCCSGNCRSGVCRGN